METCSVVLTFKSVVEILWCDHSNDTSSAVLLHGIICFSIFYKIKFGIFLEFWHLAVLGVEGLKFSVCFFLCVLIFSIVLLVLRHYTVHPAIVLLSLVWLRTRHQERQRWQNKWVFLLRISTLQIPVFFLQTLYCVLNLPPVFPQNGGLPQKGLQLRPKILTQ